MADSTPTHQTRPYFNGKTTTKPTWIPDPGRVRSALAASGADIGDDNFHRVLLTLAHCLRASYAQNNLKPEDTFKVSSQTLNRLIGTKFGPRVLTLLSDSGILTRVGNYKVGRHPFSYQLAPWCWGAAVRVPLLWPDRPIISPPADRIENHFSYSPEVIAHLQRTLELVALPEFLDLDAMVHEAERSVKKWSAKKGIHLRFAFDHFNERPAQISVGQNSGRIFHKAARLSKRLRCHLLCQGATMADVDISNSQPLLLLLLLRDRAADYAIDPNELEILLRHACAGSFYDEMERISSKAYDDREALKKAVYKGLMFGRTRAKFTRIFKDLKATYPSLAAALERLHARKEASLASELQRQEADLVYNHIAPSLMESLPGVPFLTIHDAFLIPLEHAERTAQIIKKAFKKARKVDVQVKINGEKPI